MLFSPVHASLFESVVDAMLVAALDVAGTDRIDVVLEIGIVNQLTTFG